MSVNRRVYVKTTAGGPKPSDVRAELYNDITTRRGLRARNRATRWRESNACLSNFFPHRPTNT